MILDPEIQLLKDWFNSLGTTPTSADIDNFKMQHHLRLKTSAIREAMLLWEEEKIKEMKEIHLSFYTTIPSDKNSSKNNPLKYENLLTPILKEGLSQDEIQLCNFAFLNALANIKRKMNGNQTHWDIMPILYSPKQGSGKSTLLRKFADFFGTSKNTIGGVELGLETTFEQLKNEKQLQTLSKYYFVLLDELVGISRTDNSALLKELITKRNVTVRKLYTMNTVTTSFNPVFFGSTNLPLQQVLPDTGRRFVEIPLTNNILHQFTNNLDVLDIWNSIDEDYPYQNVLMERWNNSYMKTEDTVADWLAVYVPPKNKEVSIRVLFDDYIKHCRNNGIGKEKIVTHQGQNSQFKNKLLELENHHFCKIMYDQNRHTFRKKPWI